MKGLVNLFNHAAAAYYVFSSKEPKILKNKIEVIFLKYVCKNSTRDWICQNYLKKNLLMLWIMVFLNPIFLTSVC